MKSQATIQASKLSCVNILCLCNVLTTVVYKFSLVTPSFMYNVLSGTAKIGELSFIPDILTITVIELDLGGVPRSWTVNNMSITFVSSMSLSVLLALHMATLQIGESVFSHCIIVFLRNMLHRITHLVPAERLQNL